MNYGYDKTSLNWDENKKERLRHALSRLCYRYPDEHKMHPYVEVDGLYEGIRIRRITHLTEEKRRELVKKADILYLKIMGAKDVTTEKEV